MVNKTQTFLLRKYYRICDYILATFDLPALDVSDHKLTISCCMSPMGESVGESDWLTFVILKCEISVRSIEVGESLVFVFLEEFFKLKDVGLHLLE